MLPAVKTREIALICIEKNWFSPLVPLLSDDEKSTAHGDSITIRYLFTRPERAVTALINAETKKTNQEIRNTRSHNFLGVSL
jgi:hypothetical protein